MGFDHYIVNTDWQDVAEEETEELMELPHPIPLRPEISPSFLDSQKSKTDEKQPSFIHSNGGSPPESP